MHRGLLGLAVFLSFVHYFDGPIRTGSGELAMDRLGQALDTDKMGPSSSIAPSEVKGERFPAPTEQAKVGPELSQMAPLHAAEFFAEAVINPSAVIDKGKGYQGADGSSKMPSFNDSMTVQEAIDLVAYLRSLKPVTAAPAGHRGH